MKKDPGRLIFLAHGGMELSWLYAWATFLTASMVHRPFPLPEAMGAFLLASILTMVVRGTGLRVISVLVLQVVGFLFAASRIVYALYYRTQPYFSKGWLADFFCRSREPLEWLILVIILIMALLLWLGGVTLARRQAAYLTICSRFDLGVTAFFFLLLIKFLLRVKGGIEVKDQTPVLLLFPFFIFSLLAIGLAKNRSSVRRDFLAGYRGLGVIASFTVVVLAFGAGLVLLFMPYLSAAAEAGYGVLKSAAGPLSPILIAVLRFLFRGARVRSDPASSSSGGDEAAALTSSGESSWWTELIQRIMEWGLLGLGALAALIVCAVGLWYLLRWLFSRTSTGERRPIEWKRAILWAQGLWASLHMGFHMAVQRLKGYGNAVQLYRALLKWGRRSGLPHVLSETPAEYGSRLEKRFPSLRGEIGGIVEAFNRVVYGEVMIDGEQMTRIKGSWKRLRSPRYWPFRLKSWFFQGKDRL
jgi:hypothetical protein